MVAPVTVCYEDLTVGQSESMTHTVTEKDVALFGEATGDMNPVHFDEAYARRTVFRGRVAHGGGGDAQLCDGTAAWRPLDGGTRPSRGARHGAQTRRDRPDGDPAARRRPF